MTNPTTQPFVRCVTIGRQCRIAASRRLGRFGADGCAWPRSTLQHSRCSSRISSAMFVLTLHRLLAGSNRIAAAHRGTLQCVNHVLRYLPLFVALEILGHVV